MLHWLPFLLLVSCFLLLPISLFVSLLVAIEEKEIRIDIECPNWFKKKSVLRFPLIPSAGPTEKTALHLAEHILNAVKLLSSRLVSLRQDVRKRKLLRLAKGILSAMKLKELNVEVMVGSDDAMQVALEAGAIWALGGWIRGLLSRTKVKKVAFVVRPRFSEDGLMMRAILCLSFRLYQALFLLACLLLLQGSKTVRRKRVYTKSGPAIL